MSVATTSPPTPPQARFQTVADLLHDLGDVPPDRVLWDPVPGTATEADVIRYVDQEPKRLVELVDGTLVEKPMGQYESRVGHVVGYYLEGYLEEHDIGIVYGADATLRIIPGRVRLPDVSFVPWTKLPTRELPSESIAAIAPDLAVEVLSEGNTRREMEKKRKDYFSGGTKLVWQIDPDTRTAQVFTSLDKFMNVPPDGELDGGDVLPGFKLSLKKLFERAGKRRGK